MPSHLVARRESPASFVFERGMVVLSTEFVGNRTAIIEPAPRRRVHRYGNRTLYVYRLSGHPRIGNRDGRQKRFCIRVNAGFRSISSVSPISTILPRYITAIRLHMYLATARSCVMYK